MSKRLTHFTVRSFTKLILTPLITLLFAGSHAAAQQTETVDTRKETAVRKSSQKIVEKKKTTKLSRRGERKVVKVIPIEEPDLILDDSIVPGLERNMPPVGGMGQQKNDWFYKKRAWPDAFIDPELFSIAAHQAKQMPKFTRGGKQRAQASVQWQQIGPYTVGGRVTALVTHPTDVNTFYVGAASGGVWKTTDHGKTFFALTDTFSSLPVGTLTIDPKSPETIYLGQGECNFSADSWPGNGIWRSENGGSSWQYLGLAKTQFIAKIIVDPRSSDVLYVASPGPVTLSDTNRGVYKSTDRGQTWVNVLRPRVGTTTSRVPIIDLAMNPVNPDELVAAAWDRTGEAGIAGPNTGLWHTTDAGATWSRIDTMKLGYPDGRYNNFNRTALHWAQTTVGGSVLYAAISRNDTNILTGRNSNANFHGLYQSLSPGSSWGKLQDSTLRIYYGGLNLDSADILHRQGYYNFYLAGNPHRGNELYIGGIDVIRSTDGGKSFSNITTSYGHYYFKNRTDQHPDQHHLAFTADPSGTDLLVGSDGGVYHTKTFGESWDHLRGMPITMIYSMMPWFGGMKHLGATVHIDSLKMFGGTQDNGSVATGLTSVADWSMINNADGGVPLAHPTDPEKIFTSKQQGRIFLRTSLDSLVPNINNNTSTDPEVYRKQWHNLSGLLITGDDRLTDTSEPVAFIAPVVLDPLDPTELYTGRLRIYKAKINYERPELSKWSVWSPYLTGDTTNTKSWNGMTVEAIGVGPKDASGRSMLWMGGAVRSTGGFLNRSIWRTTVDLALPLDSAPKWIDVKGTLPTALPSMIVPDPLDSMTAFISYGRYSANRLVYKTTNGGKNWTNITGNLPAAPVNAIVFDREAEGGDVTKRNQYIYAATDVGVFMTVNGGVNWFAVGEGLPTLVVNDVDIYKNWLIASTHGRSAFAIDLNELRANLSTPVVATSVNELKLYPNPVRLTVNASVKFSLDQAVSTVRLVNLTTGADYVYTVNEAGHEYEIVLPSDLSVGGYMLQVITTEGELHQNKLLIH